MKRHVIEIDGKTHVIFSEKVGSRLWFHHEGVTWDLETGKKKGQKSRGKFAGEAGGADVMAPMPGKITKLLVKEGDAVTQAQLVLVMEAMKMEYMLKAPVAGKVKKIARNVGDQVALDELLIAVDPVKEG